MALPTNIKNLNSGAVTLADATGTPITTGAVNYANGDFSASGLSEKWNNVSAYESRGVFINLAHTTRTYPSGSFSVMMSGFTNATAGLVTDAIAKNGAFAAGVSALGTGMPWALNITFAVEGTDFGDSADHSVTFTKCYCTFDIAEGDPNTVTVNWTCYGTATGDLAPTTP